MIKKYTSGTQMSIKEKDYFKVLMNSYKEKDFNTSANQQSKINQNALNRSLIAQQNPKDNLNRSFSSNQKNLPPIKYNS